MMAGQDDLSHTVLRDLARVVGAISRSAEHEAEIIEQVVSGYATSVSLARALLTNSELPETKNPGRGGPLAVGKGVANRVGAGLQQNARNALASAAKNRKAKAKELDGVRKKEQEEKGGNGEGGGGPSGTGDPKISRVDDKAKGAGTKPKTGGKEPDGKPGETDAPEGKNGDDAGGGGAAAPGTRAKPKDKAETATTNAPGDIKQQPPKVRRRYKTRIRNTSRKPVTDLHFGGDGLEITSSNLTRKNAKPPEGLKGWEAKNITGKKGFIFEAADPKNAIPPGGTTGKLEFDSESGPVPMVIQLSHSDGSLTPLSSGDITSNGKPAPQKNGKTIIPSAERTYVHEAEIETTGEGLDVVVKPSGAKVDFDGEDEFRAPPYYYKVLKNGNIRISKSGGVKFTKGEKIPLKTTSSGSTVKFKVLKN